MRALLLLGRFLDMGSWAVDLALSVGIFPYVLKLLQTTATDLRQILVFIWTKILALDKSCQVRASTPLTPLRGAFTRRVSSQRESRGFAELADHHCMKPTSRNLQWRLHRCGAPFASDLGHRAARRGHR